MDADDPTDPTHEAVDAPSADGPGVVSRFGHGLSRVVLVSIGAVFGVFALANRQAVSFSWLFGESVTTTTDRGDAAGGVPLILLLVAAFVLGAIVGRLSGWRSHRRRR
jgi:uncharacterized integral membrane protein